MALGYVDNARASAVLFVEPFEHDQVGDERQEYPPGRGRRVWAAEATARADLQVTVKPNTDMV